MKRWLECRGTLTRSTRATAGCRIPLERLRVLLLQAFYTVYSERQLMEQLDFDLLFS
jgi:hypothetical protein